ncbi:MAG: ribokinase [Candidatus Woesearchaeota archaeon]|nr:ribokinase [Candidatus Woesearchaeota archaeon]
MKHYDVVVVGGATTDVFVDTDVAEIKLNRKGKNEEFIAYPVGSKIEIKKILFSTGGGGTNSAAGFSKLGLRTGFIGAIGNDENGSKVLDELKKRNIDFLGTISKKHPTGYSVILDSVGHDRTILTFRGANDHFSYTKNLFEQIKTNWVHLSSLSGESIESLKKIANYCRKNNIPYSYNISTYIAQKGIEHVKDILTGCSVFILNKEEAGYLLNLKDTNEKDMLKSLKELLGLKAVVITDGPRGIFALKDKYYRIKAHKVNVVEATGAGDSFCAGFVSGLIKKMDFSYALKIGLVNSESVIQTKGAKNGLLSMDEALKKIKY